MKGLESSQPLNKAEERRLSLRMGRHRGELVRLLDRLPDPQRRRLLGGESLRQEMPFAQIEAIVSRLAREAEEHSDARLMATARRARALLKRLASARATLVTRNLRLVFHLARRRVGRAAILADIVQAGNLGLLEAADRFDPHRGVRFSTYAGTCITGVMVRSMPGLTQEVHVPCHQMQLGSRLDKVQHSLAQDLGRKPTLTETAALARLTENKAREIMDSKPRILNLDAPLPYSSDFRLADILAADDETDVQDRIILRDTLGHMQEILASLEPRLRKVVRLRYGIEDGHPRTLGEIGVIMKLSRERIRQLEEEALEILRTRMRRLQAGGTARAGRLTLCGTAYQRKGPGGHEKVRSRGARDPYSTRIAIRVESS